MIRVHGSTCVIKMTCGEIDEMQMGRLVSMRCHVCCFPCRHVKAEGGGGRKGVGGSTEGECGGGLQAREVVAGGVPHERLEQREAECGRHPQPRLHVPHRQLAPGGGESIPSAYDDEAHCMRPTTFAVTVSITLA